MADNPVISLLSLPPDCLATVWPGEEQEPQHLRKDGDPAARLAELKATHRNGTFESALPTSSVMMMTLDLPATDAEEIAGMVQIQAEEISPFPPDESCVSWELLSREPPRSRVLMAICSRKDAEALRSVFRAADCELKRIDVTVLGWLELLKNEGHLSSDRDELLLIRHGCMHTVVAWQRGAPSLIRSLVSPGEMSAELLTEELSLLPLSLDADFAWSEPPELTVWHDGETPAWSEQAAGGWRITCRDLSALPPVTAGLAQRGERGQTMDLAPAVWKAEAARKSSRRKTTRSLLTAGTLWLTVMLGFFGWAQFRQSGYRRLTKENRQHAAEAAKVEALAAQVRSLTQFTDRSSSALETLLILAKAAPGNGVVLVEDFRYKKEEGITFSGSIPGSVQPFYQFLEGLEANDLLQVKDYDLKERKNGFEFQAEARWSWLADASGEAAP